MLWSPAFFGVKPDLVLVGGLIASAMMGDPNASIPTPQPVHSRPMFGSLGRALSNGSVSFVSQAALERDVRGQYGLAKETVAVRDTRGGIGKRSMRLNDLTPKITVDPETYAVTADGRLLTCEPAKVVAMAQRYFLF